MFVQLKYRNKHLSILGLLDIFRTDEHSSTHKQ